MIFPPALLMIVGAVLVPVLPRRWRSPVVVLIPVVTLIHLWALPDGASVTADAIGYTLEPLHVDALSRVFGAVFAIVATAGGIYAWHIHDSGQQVAALVYGGGAIGLVFSGDLFSLLFFTELMALFSTYLIWAGRSEESRRAGTRYILAHLVGGAFVMAGILMHLGRTGDISVGAMDPDFVSSWIMLIGVAINGAVPPLHAWLPDAYPKATITGAVFLSAFTTKSSVYVLVRMFAGYEILIYVGAAMALYGVVYAVLADDIRGILAYHIVSQVGYMVAAAGIGTAFALNAAVAHAFSHILYKGLLFMGAGAAIATTGRSTLTELGGLYRRQRAIFWLYMVGAFSISGVPLFNGFISKSMVVEAAGEAHHVPIMVVLLLASIGTFLSIGLKLPYGTWFGEDRQLETTRAPRNMHAGMGLVAGLCVFFGVAPGALYRHLPFPVEYHPYTLGHLVETTQILVLTFVAFWLLRHKLAGESRVALDTDWFYRRPAPVVRRQLVGRVARGFDAADRGAERAAVGLVRTLRNPAPALQRFLAIRGSTESSRPFDADDARPVVAVALGLVLVTFVVLAVAVLL